MFRAIRFTAAIALALTLTACEDGGENGDSSMADAIRFVEGYVCTDEYERVRDLSTIHIDTVVGRLPFRYGNTVFSLWEGTPFVVDVSSTFANADRLLEVIAEESEKIHMVLGYEIFVAGKVRALMDVTTSQFMDRDPAFSLTPPEPHIDILCCYDSDSQIVGIANPWERVVVLRNDPFWSRFAIIHELYHIFGFMHPHEMSGLAMSDDLMYGLRDANDGIILPTQSTPTDLAKMSCIYS